MKDISHDDAMAEIFANDPSYAVEMLNAILADGDQSELLIALRLVPPAALPRSASREHPE